MNNLPNNWQIKSLGEVAAIITGGTPSTAVKEYWEGGNIPWLNSGELNQGIITSSSNYITKLGLKNSVAKLMPPHTVLIALTGATTGRVGYLTFEACANQSVTGILPSDNHDPKFLYYHLQTLRQQILKVAWGGAQKHINQKFVKDLKIPLPSLPIQKQIAEILEKADQAKQNRKEANKLTGEFMQSVFIEMFGDYLSEKDVASEKLGNLSSFIDYRGKTPERVDSGIPLISAKCVRRGTFDANRIDYVTENTYNQIMTRGFPKPNDVLFTTEGATMGFTCRMPNMFERFAVGQRLITIQCGAKLTSEYLEFLLNHNLMQDKIISRSTGSAAIGIRSAEFKEIKIPIPPLPLQQQFAEIVNKTEALKEKQKQSEQELENLFQSLMQKVFKGELVS